MIIRKLKITDALRIQELSRQLGYDYPYEKVAARVGEAIGKKDMVWVAECDKMAVGYVHAQYYNVLYADPALNILGLVVDEGYRHRGIAGKLMETVEREGRSSGISCIRVASGSGRKGAHRFYESLGYEFIKEQKKFHKKI